MIGTTVSHYRITARLGGGIVPHDSAVFAPGLTSYAFTKTTAQRNLYRIPLP